MFHLEKTIGFIGTGVMEKVWLRNYTSGYNVHIYTRTKEKALQLIDQGCVWHESVANLAQQADIIITMVGYPKDVEEIYLGE